MITPQINIEISTRSNESPDERMLKIPPIRMKANANPNANVANAKSFNSFFEKCQNDPECF